MHRAVFIQTNDKQLLGARLARFAIERHSPGLPVTIMAIEAYPEFAAFEGATYHKGGHPITYRHDDLQSFTLSRFKPPELMGYQGEALVIDPDIFAVADIAPIFDLPRTGLPVLACAKKGAYDSSVMVLSCTELQDWRVSAFMDALRAGERDYLEYSTLSFMEGRVAELDRNWNSLDALSADTRFLHTTNRLTQPWKTGLPIDFTRTPLPKKFGIIPREWFYRATGRLTHTYQPHPDPAVTAFFFALAADALRAGAITEQEVRDEIARGHVRPDFLDRVREHTKS